MQHRIPRALLGATLALVLAPAAAAAGSGPNVTVRVEGAAKTLLAPTKVRVPSSGSITKAGAPAGSCPAHSAAGALQLATHGRFGGSFSASVGDVFVTSILGESYSSKSTHYFAYFVDNVYATHGICATKPHPGQQLLFAAVPVSDTADYPLAFKGLPGRVRAGHAFTVKVVYVDGKGKTKTRAGARVTGNGIKTVTTGPGGTARITPTKSVVLQLRATHRPAFGAGHTYGYIRTEGQVRVTA